MAENKKLKTSKASEEQKIFLINYMEENLDFAQERFEAADGAHVKQKKWDDLSIKLNSIGGAVKNAIQWRKFWTDQKLRVKEREALVKAEFQKSGRNGMKQMKELTAFESRLLAFLVPAAISGVDKVTELFTGDPANESFEDVQYLLEEETLKEKTFSALSPCTTVGPMSITSTTGVEQTQTKRKRAPSGKTPRPSSFEENILEIENEKLMFVKKTYELNREMFDWKKNYQKQILILKQKELQLKEKEIDLKENSVK